MNLSQETNQSPIHEYYKNIYNVFLTVKIWKQSKRPTLRNKKPLKTVM